MKVATRYVLYLPLDGDDGNSGRLVLILVVAGAEAQLVIQVEAPAVQLATLRATGAMPAASCDPDHAGQRIDRLRAVIFLGSFVPKTELSVRVLAEGRDLTTLGENQCKVVTAGDPLGFVCSIDRFNSVEGRSAVEA